MPEKIIKIPKKSKYLAEFIGILLGDGNVYISKMNGVYQIKITMHSVTDKEYLMEFVNPLLQSLFGVNGSISFDKNRKGINLRLASKRLVFYLLSIGLKAGDKIGNRIIIPEWIIHNKNFSIACIRGLIDTDGIVFEHKRGSHRFHIGFKNNDLQLLVQVWHKFSELGFHPTKISINVFYLCRKDEIELFIKRIGFHNNKHLNKCKLRK